MAQDNSGVPPAQQAPRAGDGLRIPTGASRAGQRSSKGENPARFVVKQMRLLEPSPHVSVELRASPIPHDVLSRARRIETRLCHGAGLELSVLSVFTNPDVAPTLAIRSSRCSRAWG